MTDFLTQFHFLRPWWALAIIPALVLFYYLWSHQSRAHQWAKYIAPHLLPFLMDEQLIQRQVYRVWIILMLWMIAVLALMGPTWQKLPVPVERSGQALIICYDMSPSMLAEDVKPSRLLRSRMKLIDLLKARQDGVMALIAYAGEAHTITPLTDDRETIINLLNSLTPSTFPSPGSNAEMALSMAFEMLDKNAIKKGQVLFITDEITPDALDNMADSIKSSAHQITLWPIGTPQGAPIPLPQGGFAKNDRGEMVLAQLNAEALQLFAQKNGLYYVSMANSTSDIQTLLKLLAPLQKNTLSHTERQFDQWFEAGQWLCLLLLPFILWAFRRGPLLALCLITGFIMTCPPPANAMTWRSLWQTQDQQAQEDLQKGDASAAERFTTPDRRGSALYQQGQFDAAAQQFAQQKNAQNHYNQGVALTRKGDYPNAIKSFEEALKLNPNSSEIKDNLSIAQKLAELQQKQNQSQKDQNQQNSSQQQNSNSSQNNEQQQNSDQQKNSDQNSSSNASQTQNQSSQNNASQNNASQNNSSQNKSDASAGSQSSSGAQNNQTSEQNKSSQAASQNASTPNYTPEMGKSSQSSGASSENPYAQAQSASSQGSASSVSDVNFAKDMPPSSAPKTEEQQQVEQWLRKVPDDPGGLMRNKLKYEHWVRQQSPTPRPRASDQPNKRW